MPVEGGVRLEWRKDPMILVEKKFAIDGLRGLMIATLGVSL